MKDQKEELIQALGWAYDALAWHGVTEFQDDKGKPVIDRIKQILIQEGRWL